MSRLGQDYLKIKRRGSQLGIEGSLPSRYHRIVPSIHEERLMQITSIQERGQMHCPTLMQIDLKLPGTVHALHYYLDLGGLKKELYAKPHSNENRTKHDKTKVMPKKSDQLSPKDLIPPRLVGLGYRLPRTKS